MIVMIVYVTFSHEFLFLRRVISSGAQKSFVTKSIESQEMAEVTDPSIKNDDASNKDDSNEIVPFRVKVALGVGECTQAIYVFIAGFYLNVFFLETACLDPTYVGLIQLIS